MLKSICNPIRRPDINANGPAIWGIILGALLSLIIRILQFKFLPATVKLIANLDPMAMEAYATSSYDKYLGFNLTSLKIWRLYGWAVLIAALGRFMIGYWIGQTGRMYHIENYTKFFRKAMRICAWIGFSVMVITTVNSILLDAKVFSSKSDWKLVQYLLFPGSLAVGIFYAIKFAFLYQNDKWEKWLSVFKELGRMALTNYLMQTVINSIIFNGIGFG